MVQVFIAASFCSLTATFESNETAARAFVLESRRQCGYSDGNTSVTKSGSSERDTRRKFFEFGDDLVVVDRDSNKIIAIRIAKRGPNPQPYVGSLESNLESIANAILARAGWNQQCRRTIKPIEELAADQLRHTVEPRIRVEFRRIASSNVFWAEELELEIDKYTGAVVGFSLPSPCRMPANLIAVDSPNSAWNKLANYYFDHHANISWLELKSSLSLTLHDPSYLNMPLVSRAPDFASCRATNMAWLGYTFSFEVFIDGLMHHNSHGIVDGRTGNFIRSVSAGGFGPANSATPNVPWKNLTKKFSFCLPNRPKKTVSGSFVKIMEAQKKVAGIPALVLVGTSVFRAELDRASGNLQWNFGNKRLQATLAPAYKKSAIALVKTAK